MFHKVSFASHKFEVTVHANELQRPLKIQKGQMFILIKRLFQEMVI